MDLIIQRMVTPLNQAETELKQADALLVNLIQTTDLLAHELSAIEQTGSEDKPITNLWASLLEIRINKLKTMQETLHELTLTLRQDLMIGKHILQEKCQLSPLNFLIAMKSQSL